MKAKTFNEFGERLTYLKEQRYIDRKKYRITKKGALIERGLIDEIIGHVSRDNSIWMDGKRVRTISGERTNGRSYMKHLEANVENCIH